MRRGAIDADRDVEFDAAAAEGVRPRTEAPRGDTPRGEGTRGTAAAVQTTSQARVRMAAGGARRGTGRTQAAGT